MPSFAPDLAAAMPPAAPTPPYLRWTLAGLLALLAWDASGLDLTLARVFGDAQGFALREHWALAGVLHEGMRRIGWLAALWVLAGTAWPLGVLRAVPRRARLQLALSLLLGLLAIQVFKQASTSSCPWDLRLFGGVADYLSHWAWRASDGGPGHCFPAGHASAGFAFVGGYFALRSVAPTLARRWLLAACVAGLVLGLAQQARGAHFMSHTAWTAWLCWTTAWLVDACARLLTPRVASPETPAPLAAQVQAS